MYLILITTIKQNEPIKRKKNLIENFDKNMKIHKIIKPNYNNLIPTQS